MATSPMKRRQQVLKPRGSPDMSIAEAFAVETAGAASARPLWRGIEDSAGVLDRSKGTGRIAWEPEMSHSAGPASIYSEDGWIAPPPWPSNLRG